MVGDRVRKHGNPNEGYKRTEIQPTEKWEMYFFGIEKKVTFHYYYT